MVKQPVYLVAQLHVAPSQLSDWREGIATTLNMLYRLARLCQQHPELRFTHNTALLFRWAERYAPELSAQLQQLIAEGGWQSAGGWYVQPDCTLPCAEALVRQLLLGHRYYAPMGSAAPTVALNTDALGQSRGLVQLLVKSGYRVYIFRYPPATRLSLPQGPFLWEGVDGSRIVALRGDSLTTALTTAAEKLQQPTAADAAPVLLLWESSTPGWDSADALVHALHRLAEEHSDWELRSVTPEEYAAAVEPLRPHLPVVTQSLRSWAVGAYTSGMRLKQLYRRAEDRLLLAEKVVTCAAFHGRMAYPADELRHVWEELLFCQSPGILAGAGTESALHSAVERLCAVLHRAEELLLRALLRLSAGYSPAATEGLSILVFNPHPYPITALVECELPPPDSSEGTARVVQLCTETGERIPCQELQLESIHVREHRRHLCFRLQLEPQQMRRLSYRFTIAVLPKPLGYQEANSIRIRTPELELVISRHTGEIERYRVGGREYARSGFGRLLVVPDGNDPLGTNVRHFWRKSRPFRVLPKEKAAWFAGVPEPLHPVRIIEQGELCTVVEVLLHHRYRSFACLHYIIPHEGTEVELRLRLLWNERDSLLKLAFPTRLRHARCYGQSIAAVEEFSANGMEHAAQRWLCLVEGTWAFSCITESTYGFGCRSGELRLSLLRSPIYAAHPAASGKDAALPSDRFTPRMDQGEYQFRFWLNAGEATTRLTLLERETQCHLQPPPVLLLPLPRIFSAPMQAILQVEDPSVVVTALKQSEDGSELLVRLWEPTGQERFCQLHFPLFGFSTTVRLLPFALLTLRIDPQRQKVRETDLLERPLLQTTGEQ